MDIDDKIAELVSKREEIEEAKYYWDLQFVSVNHKIILAQEEKLRPTVGMCFRASNGLVRIINVPQGKEIGVIEYVPAPYDLPVLQITYPRNIGAYNKEEYKWIEYAWIEKTTIHSKAIDSDDPQECLRNEYTEISLDEFKFALEAFFESVRSLCK